MAATATAKAPKKVTKSVDHDDRDIREDHSVWLHQALGMQVHELLPEKIVDKYWELKRIADRSSMSLTQREVILMIWLLGGGRPTIEEDMPPTVLQMYRKGQVKKGDTVEVNWRDNWIKGELIEVTGNNELIVLPVGEPDERRFDTGAVRLPDLES